jgi:hypothetical protein
MNPQELNSLHIVHVTSALGLIGATFYAFAGAPETRKKALMWGGIAALLILLTGLRLWQGLHFGLGGLWIYVKFICWLGLSTIGGIAYRRREKARLLAVIAILLAATAVAMAYVKPF